MTVTVRPGVGVGVVVCNDGFVLLGHRIGSHGEGEWALPGGKVDPGEHPEDTARRELLEETGIEVGRMTVVPFWSNDVFPDENLHYVTLYFICDLPDGQSAQILEPTKCKEWGFFPWRALPSPTFAGIDEMSERWPDLCD